MERLAGIADFLGEQTHTNTSLVVLIKREIYLKYLNCFAFSCFDQLRLCPHVNRPFRPPKTGFWKTLARVEILKTETLVLVWTGKDNRLCQRSC